jgi:ABC-type multidrug transport system permease subunit
MKKREKNKFIFWMPRILSILFILFLALFSLDIFENNYTFWETILGLFMHNLPSLALLIVLIIAWRYEIVGAVAFILAGLFYIFILLISGFQLYMLLWILLISGPAFLVGILFLICWLQKKH